MSFKKRFKTNINCIGCVEKVKPYLDQIKGLEWEVDTKNPNKILTVQGINQLEQVIQAVQAAGFFIEEEQESFWKKFFE